MAQLFRRDLLDLALRWNTDARTLLAASRYDGAYHLAGIALECMLKARIAGFTKAEEFPDPDQVKRAWIHDPNRLLKEAGLEQALDHAPPDVQVNWAIVKDWTIDTRYSTAADPRLVKGFLDALDDPTHGVLAWLRSRC